MEIGSIRVFIIFIAFCFCTMEYANGSILNDAKPQSYSENKNNSTLPGRDLVGAEDTLGLVPADHFILMKGGRDFQEDHKNERLAFIPPQGAEGRAGSLYPRKDRFYYCGPSPPNNKRNHCRSLCYAMGYPTYVCGNVSCYCTF